MRMQPFPKLLGVATAFLFFATAFCGASWFDGSQKIIVVQGTTSLADTTERNQAKRLAKQFDTWLTDVGVPHKMLTDEDISPWRLWRARVVILPYNPHPSPLELKAYQRVVRSGGILLVCYGMDNDLASLMGVKLGAYQPAKSKGQWSSFEFDRTALPGLPGKVFQNSEHLVTALPNSGTTQIIARWLDARGNRTPEAAWLQSKAGFWMSHILQPGDDETKRQMLLAMLTTVFPDIWAQATEYRLSSHRPFGEYDNLEDAAKALGQTPPEISKSGKPWESYLAAQAWLSELTKLYAQRNLTNTFSLRGVWLNEEACPTPDAWPTIEAQLQRHDINAVFLHVGNPLTWRPSTQLLPAPALATRLLNKATSPALHAWLSCMNLEGATPEDLKELRDQKRLQETDTGETLNWLCPSHPENQALLANVVSQLARDKVYEGIHLDYIRYLNSHSCYCAGCRQRFEQGSGRSVARWPEAVRSGTLSGAFQMWRANQISDCVSTLAKAIHTVNPGLPISAAVYAATPACYTSVGQDWPEWLRRNFLNFVCPMNYTSYLTPFKELLAAQKNLCLPGRIYPGVGIASSLSQLSPDQAAAQLILIQNGGFPGFVLFEYNQDMAKAGFPYLAAFPQKPKARNQKL